MKSKAVSIVDKSSSYSRIAISFVLILSLVFAVWAAIWGIAEVLTIGPNTLMSRWEKQSGIDNEGDWERAFSSMKCASRLNPGNPDVIYDMGRLLEWRALQKPLWTAHAHHFREAAIQKYRQSLKLRPTWALAWVSLAQNKFLNQEIDQEMWRALENAIDYAPWEAAVQRKVIWLGIATWRFNTPELKEKVSEIIDGSLRRPHLYDYVLRTSVNYRWEENLKPMLDEHQEQLLFKLVQRRD